MKTNNDLFSEPKINLCLFLCSSKSHNCSIINEICYKTIRQLRGLAPEVIIYVSCNVLQLKKELPLFKNYGIKSTSFFDLFPQTNHSKVVVELVKKRELGTKATNQNQ